MKKIRKSIQFWGFVDLLVAKIVENTILKYVKKTKYKNHKYHVMCWFLKANIFILFLVQIVLRSIEAVLKGRSVLFISWNTIVWLILIAVIVNVLLKQEKISERYDWLFLNRKHPEVYKQVLELCKVRFIAEGEMRLKYLKLMSLLLMVVLSMLLMSLWLGNMVFMFSWLALIFNLWCYTMSVYVDYVFDFDKPNKRKKVKKESLTEIMKKEIENAIRGYQPDASSI